MERSYKVNDVNTKYDGFMKVRSYNVSYDKLDGGENTFSYEVVDRGQSVCVIAYDPKCDLIFTVRQFRPGAMVAGFNPFIVELVAGSVDNNEDPSETAVRETREEINLVPKDVHYCSSFYNSPGGLSEITHVYLCIVDYNDLKSNKGGEDNNEDIEIIPMSINDFEKECLKYPTYVGNIIALNYLKKIRGQE